MNIDRLAALGAVVLGVVSGSSALDSAAMSHPPIEWATLPFVLLASLLGIVFVVGLQLMRGNPVYSRWAIRLFFPVALWFLVAGFSAFVIAFTSGAVTAAAMLYLCIGTGVLLGVWSCRILFHRKFGHAP